ncbi:[Pyruvate dehydrogenase [acetyl-transferring]]-phosphatase 1, mitochondrial [Chytridiales sp. JEL 0842]|nr:[Pyruvate dehydrogenase [acetyl-transferring]]-phosphatase 1, mitochondrial [Chytridiales sp. JEL 0842]
MNILLSEHQKSYTYSSPDSHVEADIHVSSFAANSPIEDTYSIKTIKVNDDITEEAPSVAVAGVFDGHLTNHCAIVLASILPYYIQQSLKATYSPTSSLPANVTTDERIPYALVNSFMHFDKNLMALPKIALPDFDKLTPDEIRALPQETLKDVSAALWPAISGACGLVTVISDNQVFVANAGDCRAVLGSTASKWTRFLDDEKVKDGGGYKNGFKPKHAAVQLSRDHQAFDMDEYNRLQREHPGEEETVAFARYKGSPVRVLGSLMPTRAFGDAQYKWPIEVNDKVDAINPLWEREFKSIYKTPPYVTAEPDIAQLPLPVPDDDAFLILATDGVFERLTSQQAVDAVSNFLSNPCSFYPPWPLKPDSAEESLNISQHSEEDQEHIVDNDNLATALIRAAFFAPGMSKSGASRLMTLPPGARGARGERDDMTAIVIRFRKKGKKRSGGMGGYEPVEPVKI